MTTRSKRAGSAAFAARAGVAAVTAKDALDAAQQASRIAGLMPSNNLAGPAVFDFAAPAKTLNLPSTPRLTRLRRWRMRTASLSCNGGYGKAVYTALATVGGMTAGIVCYGKSSINHHCTAKAARFNPPVRRFTASRF